MRHMGSRGCPALRAGPHRHPFRGRAISHPATDWDCEIWVKGVGWGTGEANADLPFTVEGERLLLDDLSLVEAWASRD